MKKGEKKRKRNDSRRTRRVVESEGVGKLTVFGRKLIEMSVERQLEVFPEIDGKMIGAVIIVSVSKCVPAI